MLRKYFSLMCEIFAFNILIIMENVTIKMILSRCALFIQDFRVYKLRCLFDLIAKKFFFLNFGFSSKSNFAMYSYQSILK
jgi:hypothetical protein